MVRHRWPGPAPRLMIKQAGYPPDGGHGLASAAYSSGRGISWAPARRSPRCCAAPCKLTGCRHLRISETRYRCRAQRATPDCGLDQPLTCPGRHPRACDSRSWSRVDSIKAAAAGHAERVLLRQPKGTGDHHHRYCPRWAADRDDVDRFRHADRGDQYKRSRCRPRWHFIPGSHSSAPGIAEALMPGEMALVASN